MDVTTQVDKQITIMGGSGTTNSAYASSSKSLNFHISSNSIQNAGTERVTAIPYTINYNDAVGLFGAENIFVKVQLNIQSATSAFTNLEVAENSYFPVWTLPETDTINFYVTAEMDFDLDRFPQNDYEPAKFSNNLSEFLKPYVRVDLNNLKTGNKYIDAWFDARIYNSKREEHPYDTIYVGANDYFYVGFHARNTRRIPYNVEVVIGEEYIDYYDLTAEQRRYVA